MFRAKQNAAFRFAPKSFLASVGFYKHSVPTALGHPVATALGSDFVKPSNGRPAPEVSSARSPSLA